jgi:hypothetical protein
MPVVGAGVCASCGLKLTYQKDMFQERLEYMGHGNALRLRTVPLRDPVCSSCANSIADTAKRLDFPTIAALEVVTKLIAYVKADPADREDTWHQVSNALRRFGEAGDQPPLF